MKARDLAWLLGTILSGYTLAWTYGLFVLAPRFLFFVLTGRIRIRGYWWLILTVLRGRAVILLNHPTLFFETFMLGALLFPLYLFFPHCILFTMPDKKLLDGWKTPRWQRFVQRCIVVDRSSKIAGGRGAIKATKILMMHGVIVIHPEEGRTFGKANRDRLPIDRNGRVMQEILDSRATEIAHRAGAWILPGYIEVPYAKEDVDLKECLRRTLYGKKGVHWPIVYHFGRPYRTTEPFDLARENVKLQDEIFNS